MTTQLTTTRQQRGQAIARLSGQIQKIEDAFYTVQSQSGNGQYVVTKVDKEWICECSHKKFRYVECKHIYAVELSEKMRASVKKSVVIQEVEVSDCIFCHFKRTKEIRHTPQQSWRPTTFRVFGLGKSHSVNIGSERMKHNPKAISTAMQLYFSEESVRNT
ncbi:MAG: hypothetical protein ACE14S_01335 [Candidatus Bathyarchaeia archaeon]